jgi:predicted peptidase
MSAQLSVARAVLITGRRGQQATPYHFFPCKCTRLSSVLNIKERPREPLTSAMLQLLKEHLCMATKPLFLLAIVVTLLGAASVSNGQTVKGFLPFSQTVSNITIPFRLFVPSDYNATNEYPLIVYLHGVGSRGNNNIAQLNSGFTDKFAGKIVQAKYPCFILSPQCPPTHSWSDGTVSTVVMSIIDSLKLKYSLDKNRVYLTGWSMGGKGTFNVLANYPGAFAAAVPMSGAGDSSRLGNISKTPLWISHGTQDPTANISGSYDIVYALTNHGDSVLWYKASISNINQVMAPDAAKVLRAKYVFTEITDGAHVHGQRCASNNPLLPDWLFSQRKSGQ